jgi:hypothetical protein
LGCFNMVVITTFLPSPLYSFDTNGNNTDNFLISFDIVEKLGHSLCKFHKRIT